MNLKATTLKTAMAATVLTSSITASFADTKKAYCPRPNKKHAAITHRVSVRPVAPCDAVPNPDAEMARMQQSSIDHGVGGSTDTWFGPSGQIMVTESAKISYDSAHGCAYNAHTERLAGTIVLQGKAKFSIIAEPVAVVAGDVALGGFGALGAHFIANGIKSAGVAQANATAGSGASIGGGLSGIHTQLTATNGSVITSGAGASTNLSGATLAGSSTGTVVGAGNTGTVAGVNATAVGANAIYNPYGTLATGNAQIVSGTGTLINGGVTQGSASVLSTGLSSATGGASGEAFSAISATQGGVVALPGSTLTASEGAAIGGKDNTTTGQYGNAQSANGKGASFNTGTNGVAVGSGTASDQNANLSTNNTTGAAGTIATGSGTAAGGVSSTQSCYNADNGSGNSTYTNPNNSPNYPSLIGGGAGPASVNCKAPTL